MNVNYGQIIQRSFQIVKDNRSLWLFGILVAIFNIGGNIPNFNSNISDTKYVSIPKIDPDTIWIILAIVALAVIVFGLIGLFVSSLSRAALIDMVNKAHTGEPVSLKAGFSTGFSLALPLILIGLLLFVPFAVAVLLIGAVTIGPGILLVISKAEVFGFIVIVIGALILIAVLIVGGVALTIISQFAGRYYVLDNEGVIDSIKRAYWLFRSRLGASLLLWLINILISLIEGIIVFILILVLGLPIILLSMAVSLWLLVFLIMPLVVIAFISGLFEAYYSAFWTLAFKELTSVSLPEN